jgi:hypothetical protein
VIEKGADFSFYDKRVHKIKRRKKLTTKERSRKETTKTTTSKWYTEWLSTLN